jgi:YggT family protein
MTVERREEHTEVVNYIAADVRPVDTPMRNSTPTTAYQTETTTGDPFAARRTRVLKLQQGIYLLFGILEGLLGLRFVLGMLGANPAAGFTRFIYGVTTPFIAPFVGLFEQPRFEGIVFEWNALVAILVYALLAGVLAKVVTLVMGDTRRGNYTTTTSHIDSA